jgi:hypothetical protein
VLCCAALCFTVTLPYLALVLVLYSEILYVYFYFYCCKGPLQCADINDMPSKVTDDACCTILRNLDRGYQTILRNLDRGYQTILRNLDRGYQTLDLLFTGPFPQGPGTLGYSSCVLSLSWQRGRTREGP